MRQFTKDIKIIKFCKVCRVEFRPDRGSPQAGLGLCYEHRKIFYRKKSFKWFKSLSPERRKYFQKRQYPIWLKWVVNNIEKRRRQARESYHRRKHLHKDKKHVKVKK